MAEIETSREARQGPKGKPVLYVLIGALALAVVYLIGMTLYSGTTSPPHPASQSTEAARDTAKDNAAGSTTGSTNKAPATTPTPQQPVPPKP